MSFLVLKMLSQSTKNGNSISRCRKFQLLKVLSAEGIPLS